MKVAFVVVPLTTVAVQEEAQRLDNQQLVFHRIFDHRLIFPPIPQLRRVLDCGHGSGSWAVEVAEEYPDCEVRAVPSPASKAC